MNITDMQVTHGQALKYRRIELSGARSTLLGGIEDDTVARNKAALLLANIGSVWQLWSIVSFEIGESPYNVTLKLRVIKRFDRKPCTISENTQCLIRQSLVIWEHRWRKHVGISHIEHDCKRQVCKCWLIVCGARIVKRCLWETDTLILVCKASS